MGALRSLAGFSFFVTGFAAVALTITNSYYQLMMTLVLVWAVFGLAWNIACGYTGLLSFGHSAFFGIGAYITVLGQVYFGFAPWMTMPVAMAAGALCGLLVGFPTFRLRGHYFALAMLAYPLALLYLFEWLGYQEVTFPIQRDATAWFMQFHDPRVNTLIALVFLVTAAFVTRLLERSRFGMALLAIKQNEAAAEAAGIDTLAWKLRAITVSGAMAALIGGFYSIVMLVVTPPSVFGMLVSAQALTIAMFGGVGTIWGPLIGSVILVPVSEILHAELGARIPGIQGVVFGSALVMTILLAPEGIYWRVRDLLQSKPGRTAPSATPPTTPAAGLFPAPPGAAAGEVILSVRQLSKSFGGLAALQNVTFDVRRGEVLGIIGPNGAGKTTLFNVLNGFLAPDAGRALLDGVDVIGRKPHELCAAGVGRTFQIMRPFMRMSVRENVVVGAYTHTRTDVEAVEWADAAVAAVGLSEAAARLGRELTTKELRLMELARALAGRPRLLLLDETLAGLGHSEVGRVLEIIRRIANTGVTVVIIEHTMSAMVQLVDRFVVLDHGTVLTEGAPEAVTTDRRVIEAYLGKRWSAYADA